MTMNGKTERLHWIDIARGICIIAIVVGHVFNDGMLRWCVYSFHVPAFFFLSGLCYKGSYSWKEYVTKRIKTIVIPYLFFSILSILVFFIAAKFVPSLREVVGGSFSHSFVEMLYGNSKPEIMKYNLPLWFLPCFFSTSILVFCEEKVSNAIKRKWLRWVFIVLFACMGWFFSAHENIALPWHLETAVSMAVWFILGIIAQEALLGRLQLQKRSSALAIGTFCIVGGILLSFLNVRIVGVRNEHYGIILVYYISALTSIIGIIGISLGIEKCRLIEYLGQISIGILVLHKFPIVFFQKLVPFTREALANPDSIIGIATGLVVSIISVAISALGTTIIIHTIPWSLGKRRAHRNEN